VSVAKGEQTKVKTAIQLPKRVEAPVAAGQVLGEMVATLDGNELARVKLVAAVEVPKANLWESIWQGMRRVFTMD
jgi:D-alanyl-D-alanine carboxypeptidase (penicillin-binding protein 5/6)